MCKHGKRHIGFMCVDMMEHSFTINSVIQGYHVYKDGCDAPT